MDYSILSHLILTRLHSNRIGMSTTLQPNINILTPSVAASDNEL
jgi:hypothetical protein